jgi:hypothetical protein
MFCKTAGALVGLTMFGITGSASATLIVNGGFESGLSGWSCTGADLCGNIVDSGVLPHSGSDAMQGYDNSGFATLSQTIVTSAGASYDFALWSYASQDSAANVMRYSLDGGAIQTVLRTSDYSETVGSFIASGASALIEIYFETDGGTGTWLLDDVSVTAAIPEPATLALFGLGLVGLGAVRRRKQAAI